VGRRVGAGRRRADAPAAVRPRPLAGWRRPAEVAEEFEEVEVADFFAALLVVERPVDRCWFRGWFRAGART
jgi:hypothetical protein